MWRVAESEEPLLVKSGTSSWKANSVPVGRSLAKLAELVKVCESVRRDTVGCHDCDFVAFHGHARCCCRLSIDMFAWKSQLSAAETLPTSPEIRKLSRFVDPKRWLTAVVTTEIKSWC
ncbi:hypothetical protein V6N13_105751 [Hibiscus sabdariffa]